MPVIEISQTRRRARAVVPDADRQDGPGRSRRSPSGRAHRGPRDRRRVRQGLRGLVPRRPATSSSSRPRTAASTASSSAGSEARHDHRDTRPVRPARRGHRRRRRLAELAAEPRPEPAPEGDVKTKELLIIDYSGDLEKVWADDDPRLDQRRDGRPDPRLRDVLGPPGLRQGLEADHRRELDAEDDVGDAAARASATGSSRR